MKNVKKVIENKIMWIRLKALLNAFDLATCLMAHIPGGARICCDAIDDKNIRVFKANGSKFTLIDACREVSINGAESEILREMCEKDGIREARKMANVMRRFDANYSLLSLLAMEEEKTNI